MEIPALSRVCALLQPSNIRAQRNWRLLIFELNAPQRPYVSKPPASRLADDYKSNRRDVIALAVIALIAHKLTNPWAPLTKLDAATGVKQDVVTFQNFDNPPKSRNVRILPALDAPKRDLGNPGGLSQFGGR
jgi:hypothetical protein